MPIPLPEARFRAQLLADAARRERTVSWVVLGCAALLIPIELALSGVQGAAMSRELVFALLGLMGYEAGVLGALRLRRRVTLISAINVAVESTFLAFLLWLTARTRSPLIALTSSLHVAWPAMVGLSALRGRWRLSLAAGALAGAAYLAVFASLGLDPHALPDTVTLSGILMRVFFLLAAGAVAAATAWHLTRNAETAFRALRAQDLMSKYLLRQRLGEGGMGEVYLATYCPEGGFEKDVAVKKVLPELSADPAFCEQFLAEAKTGSLLNHPNVVQVLDVGKFDGAYLIAMEYVEGAALDRLLDGRAERLPLAAVIDLAEQVAAALEYIHEVAGPQGHPLKLIHRDVNPPNILVSRFGQVKLTDFGIAVARPRARADSDATIAGKLGYMAPEAAFGRPEPKSDVYALGVTLREALTGQVVAVPDVDALEGAWATFEVRMSTVRPGLPAALAELVDRLLAREPERRPTARQLRSALARLASADPALAQGREALTRAVQAHTTDAREIDAARRAATAALPARSA